MWSMGTVTNIKVLIATEKGSVNQMTHYSYFTQVNVTYSHRENSKTGSVKRAAKNTTLARQSVKLMQILANFYYKRYKIR